MANRNEAKGRNSATNFFTVEAYKIARTNIALSVIKQGCKKILITSSVANEGKTTTACNIAAAFSKQLNTRVLLVDCDLRKPDVARFFKIKNTPGLTNYLGGLCSLEETIKTVPNTNLSVLCAGLISPNPSELLASNAFAELVEKLSQNYDYILFDAPPLAVVIDALPLVKLVDGTVLVAFENHSSYKEMDKTVELLKRYDSKIVGFVLNGSATNEKKYAKYSYKYSKNKR